MDGDEEVSVRLIGHPRSVLEADEVVVLAGEEHLKALVGEDLSEPQGHGQRDVLFLRPAGADGARVVASVTSINHHPPDFQP